MLLATMLTELAAGVFETAAAVFHTPDHIAAALTQAAESSEDNPSDNPDDACLHRIPRMLPAAALCPGTETVTASTRPPYGPHGLPHLLHLSDLTPRTRHLRHTAARAYPVEAAQASATSEPFTRKAFAVRIHTAPQPHKHHSWNSLFCT